MHEEILSILEGELVVSPSDHPDLRKIIERHVTRKKLRRVLGDIYSTPEAAKTFEVKVAAARAVHPNCVFVRETAARMSWLKDLELDRVQVAVDRRHPFPGFAFERRVVPEDLRQWDGHHFVASPALTALDLTDSVGGAAITDALRRKAVTVDDLEQALELTKGRRGNARRARLVREARDEPWSELERDAHIRLRKAHFSGWVANHPVMIRGKLFFIDLAVPEVKLAVEVDGWTVHRTYEAFVSDRKKWNELARAGWAVLHFTSPTMDDLVAQMQEMVALLQRG